MWIAYFLFCGIQYGEMRCHSSYSPQFFDNQAICMEAANDFVGRNRSLWEAKGHPDPSLLKYGCEELSRPT